MIIGISAVFQLSVSKTLHMESDILRVLEAYEAAETAFTSGNTSKALKAIQSLFDKDPIQTLDLFSQFFRHCKNLKSHKCLAILAANELKKWHSSQRDISDISEETKSRLIPALIIPCHSILLTILIEVYRLNQPPNEFLKRFVVDLISRDRLKDAACLASKLGLHEHFALSDLVLPMVAQNKTNSVENYLAGSKVQQLQMISLLDSLLQQDFDIVEFFKGKNIFQVQLAVLRPKYFSKLLTRWLKFYCGISDPFSKECQELCPNLFKQKSLSSLRYLLHRHYVEELSTVEVTQELIVRAVGNDKYLQQYLVDILIATYNDMESAKQWAELYNIQHDDLVDYQSKLSAINENSVDDQWECEPLQDQQSNLTSPIAAQVNDWYELNLSFERITFVNSSDALICCERDLLGSEVVGIDSEWIPDFARVTEVSLSILQIATFQCVYIIDIQYILSSGPESLNLFCDLITKVFSSDSILKIGYGMREDLKKLAQSFPAAASTLKSPSRVTDLATSVSALERLYPDLLDFTDVKAVEVAADTASKKERGLSKLTFKCLGKPLNKAEQMSDWGRRPLRQSQLLYAALDAYVLLELYNFIHGKMKLENIEESLESISCSSKNWKRQVKSKVARLKTNQENNNGNPRQQIRPRHFKVVCDNMLQGAGRQLRCCGVNVKILSNRDDHETAAKIALEDGRILLTSGVPYQYLASQVPKGDCLDVPCGIKAKLQAAIVLEHYNVKVTPQDIFSRCQICNGDKYLQVTADVMGKCYKAKQRIMQTRMPSSAADTTLISLKNYQRFASVGRGKHTIEKNLSTFTSGSKCPVNVGRGRAMRDQLTNLGENTGKAKPSKVPYTDTRSDDEDELLFTDMSPSIHTKSDLRFAPISTQFSASQSKEMYPTKFQEVDMPSDDLCEPSNFVSSEASSHTKDTTEVPKSCFTQTHPRNPCSNKDGTIPYIVNPNSVCTEGNVDMANLTIVSAREVSESGSSTDPLITELRCEQVPPPILSTVKMFYCCVNCGKVYWEGRHFADVLEKFSHLLTVDEDGDESAAMVTQNKSSASSALEASSESCI